MDGLKMKYFVLNPNKDDIYGEASRRAMLLYSEIIQDENKKFSEGIKDWIISISIAKAK